MENKTNSFKNLKVWQESKLLSVMIYEVTAKFPKEEMYGTVNQFRRASVSISSNVAEGYGRQYKKETIQFLSISKGSLNEVESILEITLELKFITQEQYNFIIEQIIKLRSLLNGFTKYIRENNQLN